MDKDRSKSSLPKINNPEYSNPVSSNKNVTAHKDLRRTLHDMETFKQIKMTSSSPFFRETRVQTCSHVLVKNGNAVAVAFPLDKTGWKNPNSY